MKIVDPLTGKESLSGITPPGRRNPFDRPFYDQKGAEKPPLKHFCHSAGRFY
jgi:hypothetical protein